MEIICLNVTVEIRCVVAQVACGAVAAVEYLQPDASLKIGATCGSRSTGSNSETAGESEQGNCETSYNSADRRVSGPEYPVQFHNIRLFRLACSSLAPELSVLCEYIVGPHEAILVRQHLHE